jgi:catechol 2,3-dioxygenase-like lactoylglutathione lyase family enzyme
MNNQGIHHLGLATHNMEATITFYEEVLGFSTRVCDILQPQTGGTIRHAFLDAGNGELVAFMECNDVAGINPEFDPGINRGLGIAGGMFHFAFKASDEADLQARRADLADKGIEVSSVVDHGWCKSIYFKDPNDLQLEFCCLTQVLDDSHLTARDQPDWRNLARS